MSVENKTFQIKDPDYLNTRRKKRRAALDPIYEDWKSGHEPTKNENGGYTFHIKDDPKYDTLRKRNKERIKNIIPHLFGGK